MRILLLLSVAALAIAGCVEKRITRFREVGSIGKSGYRIVISLDAKGRVDSLTIWDDQKRKIADGSFRGDKPHEGLFLALDEGSSKVSVLHYQDGSCTSTTPFSGISCGTLLEFERTRVYLNSFRSKRSQPPFRFARFKTQRS